MVMSNQKFCFVQPRWCLSGKYNVSPFKGKKFFAALRSGSNFCTGLGSNLSFLSALTLLHNFKHPGLLLVRSNSPSSQLLPLNLSEHTQL